MPPRDEQRTDLQLRNLEGTLLDLEDIAPDWETQPLHVRAAWHMEWRNDMEILAVLQEQYENQTMNTSQVSRFLALLATIQRLLPTIHRLELDAPRVPLKT